MYWLSRPPYWRWLAATAVVVGAAVVDLAGPASEKYPFTAATVDTGQSVVIEWKDVPRGLLPQYGETSGVAGQPLTAGTPLVDGLLESVAVVPKDWWAVSVELPTAAVAGSEVMITTRAPDLEVVGIIVTPSNTGGFGAIAPGLVALPPDQAPTIANALAEHRATILVRP